MEMDFSVEAQGETHALAELVLLLPFLVSCKTQRQELLLLLLVQQKFEAASARGRVPQRHRFQIRFDALGVRLNVEAHSFASIVIGLALAGQRKADAAELVEVFF